MTNKKKGKANIMNDNYGRNYVPYKTYRDDVYVKDEEKSKEAAYKEIEELALSMLQIMDANGIDIFEYAIRSPQRKRAFTIIAEANNII